AVHPQGVGLGELADLGEVAGGAGGEHLGEVVLGGGDPRVEEGGGAGRQAHRFARGYGLLRGVDGDDDHREFRCVDCFGVGRGVVRSSVPHRDVGDDRPRGGARAAPGEAGEGAGGEVEPVGPGGGEGEGGETGGGGSEPRRCGRFVVGDDVRTLAGPGEVAHEVEEALHAAGGDLSGRCPVELEGVAFAAEGDGRRRRVGVQREGERGRDGKDEVFIAFAPVLDEGNVGVGAGGDQGCPL